MALGEVCVCELARMVGWHRSRIYDVLNCDVDLCIDKLAPLADGLGTTPSALLRQRTVRS